MRPLLLLFTFAGALVCTASAQTSIPIFNPAFNTDALNCTPSAYCYEQGGISGWLTGPSTGIIKPGTAQFPGGVPEGANVAYLGGSSITGSLSQALGATLQANTTYTLTLHVGHRLDEPFTGYLSSLQAGGVTVASSSGPIPPAGTFLEHVTVYQSGASPLQLGQPLAISIRSLGTGQTEIAEISLTVQ